MLQVNEDGLLTEVRTWTYDDFQIHAGPYRVTPSMYNYLVDWYQQHWPTVTEHEAVQAYFALAPDVREIMHHQTVMNMEVSRTALLRQRHTLIMAEIQLGIPFTQLISAIERKIQILERDIRDEREWRCSLQ